MSKESEYKDAIKSYDNHDALLRLWKQKKKGEIDGTKWPEGKLFEYIMLRAFELEGAEITYPYTVNFHEDVVEQIDGAIKIDSHYILVECKDYSKEKINIDPIAKLRNQLLRRHSSVFGMFFSASGYTDPVEDLIKFMAPQMIILWNIDDIDYCMEYGKFVDCFYWKYKYAVERCEYNIRYGTTERMEDLKNGK